MLRVVKNTSLRKEILLAAVLIKRGYQAYQILSTQKLALPVDFIYF